MARTPLLDSIERLLRAGACSGSPASRARTRSHSRRDFLKLSGAILAATPFARPPFRPRDAPIGRTRGGARIAIVGGGIAGLHAALVLADAGVAATVFEASDRIGGRMFTNAATFASGQVAEWCGEFIDSDHSTIQALARRFGLELVDLNASEPAGAEETWYFDGEYYLRAEAARDFRRVTDALHADAAAIRGGATFDRLNDAGRALDRISVHDWIESRVPGGHDSRLGALLDVTYSAEYGADTAEQSALNLVTMLSDQPRDGGFSEVGTSDERYHIAGGNEQLPRAVARHLLANGGEARVRLRHRLRALRGHGPVELVFEAEGNEAIERADLVLLALPFATLRNVDLAGVALDARKLRAIRELGAGRHVKLHLQFTHRHWNEHGAWPGRASGGSISDTGCATTWDATRCQQGRPGILTCFAGGSAVDECNSMLPHATAARDAVVIDARRALVRTESVFPGLSKHWNGRAIESLPHRSELLGASYSYWRVGQYGDFAGYERARQGPLYFAGEHTSVEFQGLMEGGAREGERAARQMLRVLGPV